jgi:magnesium chelatase subunit H
VLTCPLHPCAAAGSSAAYSSKLEEAVRIRDLLARNTEELDGVLKALRGEYVEPEAGGDLLRDGAGGGLG